MKNLEDICRLNQVGCDKRNWRFVTSSARLPGQFISRLAESRHWRLFVLVLFESGSRALVDLQAKTV